MPRKAFNADVQAASTTPIPGVTSVRKGDDDGDITFVFAPRSGAPIHISLLALDVSGYPSENTFMIFTQSPDVPNGVNEVLEEAASASTGMQIPKLIADIAQQLQRTLATGSSSDPLDIDDSADDKIANFDGQDSDADDDLEFDDEDGLYDIDDQSDDDMGVFKPVNSVGQTTAARVLSIDAAAKLNKRIRADLRAVRFAGFKLGILRGLKADSQMCLLSISMQVSKLGLSDEVLQAWDLKPEQHIVLLIRYASGYKTFEEVISQPSKSLDISFRIGVCQKYKPPALDAVSAFAEIEKTTNWQETHENEATHFGGLFISSSLNEFLNDMFISLVKIRKHASVGWDGAKLFFKTQQGRPYDANFHFTPEYFQEEPPAQTSLPDMMKHDHLTDAGSTPVSFPLVAAQFALRYVLRCTEFCLVCHDRLPGDFEALKPYVCSNPLCLYQYMSLGFGPSLEHEILTQPFVVDLLVSLCYVAAHSQKIREYPTGMCLLVPPPIPHPVLAPAALPPIRVSTEPTKPIATLPKAKPNKVAQQTIDLDEMEVKYDYGRKEIIFEDNQPCPVWAGDWIVLTTGFQQVQHRVMDISLYPAIKLSGVGLSRGPEQPTQQNVSSSSTHPTQHSTPMATTRSPFTPAPTPPPSVVVTARMTVYKHNFDDLDDNMKAQSIIMLLDTLPSVKEMREYLVQQNRITEPNLRSWKERISPAALGLLRWIIASNRSCIVQVEECPGQEDMETSIRHHEKCSNVPMDWIQFRFAQGAPDKEQRFLQSLKDERSHLSDRYPTLFAFHGSTLPNWHSIIRHGLDFKVVDNGRAYGNGVYHALQQNVSRGYAGTYPIFWPRSLLKIRTMMSLNEIVNVPTKYLSHHPYLVVQHVDWIQCRYLLVQSAAADRTVTGQNAPDGDSASAGAKDQQSRPKALSSVEIEQDPTRVATSIAGKQIGIPECAMSVSRAFRTNRVSRSNSVKSSKRRKHTGSNTSLSGVDSAMSDDEDIEDINFLFSEDESPPSKSKGKGPNGLLTLHSGKKEPEKMTDFVPGALDQSELPMLDPPAYATTSATMRLQKELQAILKVQKSTPLHELGWYIDAALVTNVYQWIVELHSFDPSLPLAKDMKTAGLTSIVLEIRFGKDYPHSPPFIRVIKPRFLPFMMGGGGHVTGGGAMCMELLTNSGWSAASSIEGVLLQVRMAIMNLEPKPARLENTATASHRTYGTGEAMEAFVRACRAHGWEVPKDFKDFGTVAPAGTGSKKPN